MKSRVWGDQERPTISIVDVVIGMLAPEQQIWGDEIRGPGCIDCVEIVVCRDRVDVGV